MHHGTNTSEKASSLSGGISVGSRSDDEKVKAMMTFDSEEAWPTLDQSREHSIKKKPNSVSSSEKRLVSDRSRKGRQNRGVPLSPEEQNKLFYNEKSDRLSKERRERVIEKERSHQRRHSLQNDFRPHSYSKPKEPSEPEPTPIDASAVQPLKDVTPRFGQGGRSRGRFSGRGRTGRGRSNHSRSYSHDPAYYGAMPPGLHPMYPPLPMFPPMYYPPMPPYGPMPPLPGMLYPAGPMPTIPMPGFSRQQIVDAAQKQIEYYLSEENLTKDNYLRSIMDNDGWIPLPIIMNFNRLRTLTMDATVIIDALCSSEHVELSDDLAFLRTKDYENWVLPEDQQKLTHLPTKHVPYVPNVSNSMVKIQDVQEALQLSEERDGDRPAGGNKDSSKANRLIVVIREPENNSSISRREDASFSALHGDSSKYPAAKQSLNGKDAGIAGNGVSCSCPSNPSHCKSFEEQDSRFPFVSWFLKSSSFQDSKWISFFLFETNSMASRTPLEDDSLGDCPVHRDGNVIQVDYNHFYSQCIKDRNTKGCGKSEEMRKLYRLWWYYLRQNFDEQMYSDFKRLALEDSEEGDRYGLERLFNFYSYGLQENFDDRLYTDFEEITLTDFDSGHRYGLEKFWAFHHYGGIPNTSEVHVNPRLMELIEKRFSTLDALRHQNEGAKPVCSDACHRCTNPGHTMSSSSPSTTLDRRLSSVQETETVLSVQNESLSVA